MLSANGSTRDYLLHGLRLRANFDLPCLPGEAGSDPEILAEWLECPLAPPGTEPDYRDGFQRIWRRSAQSWCVSYAALGRQTTVELRCGAPRSELRLHDATPRHFHHLMLGPMITLILQARQALVLHGTALVRPGRAILLLGASGAGKSTTAAAMLGQGWRLLADDLVAPDLHQAHASLQAGSLHLKLWPDTARALGLEPEHLPLVYPEALGQGDKRYLEPSARPDPGPYPLVALVFLLPRAPGLRRPVLTALGRAQALPWLMGNLRPGFPLASGDHAAQLLKSAQLARICPAFTFQAPPRLEDLSGLAGSLDEQLQAATARG